MALFFLILKIIRSINKLIFSKNNKNKPIFRKTNSNDETNRFGIGNNSVKYIKKSKKLKSKKLFKF